MEEIKIICYTNNLVLKSLFFDQLFQLIINGDGQKLLPATYILRS